MSWRINDKNFPFHVFEFLIAYVSFLKKIVVSSIFLDEMFNLQWKFQRWITISITIQLTKIITSLKNFFYQTIIEKNAMSIIFPLNQNFLFHRSQQTGGSINQAPPINILRRGPIVYYSIYFQQIKNFMIFTMKVLLIVFSVLCNVRLHWVL